MKTLKYMALAALVCSGQQAISMGSNKPTMTMTSTSNTKAPIEVLQERINAIVLIADQILSMPIQQNMLSNLISMKTLTDQELAKFINSKPAPSQTAMTQFKGICATYDKIGQLLKVKYSDPALKIFNSDPNGQLLDALINWQKNIETSSKLKRKDTGTKDPNFTLGKKTYKDIVTNVVYN